MSNQKGRKLLDSESESQQQEIIEVSIKKAPQNIPKIQQKILKTKKIEKKQIKEVKPKINAQLKKLLEQKIEDEKILKQLSKGPLNFGDQQVTNNRKILLIEQKVRTSKKQSKLGVNLIFQKKALPRKGSNRLSTLMSKCDALRGNIGIIKTIKTAKV